MRGSRTLAKAGLLLVSLLLTLAAAELVLRAVLPAPIEWRYPQERYERDPEVGHRLAPEQRAFTHDEPVRTNSRGLRDADYPSRPERGTLRLLALGDSQTFGNGLPLEATWPKQLERALRERGGAERYEVLNAGVPATDTWQHAILLERHLEAYAPDGVVLGFYVNDVSERYEPGGRTGAIRTSPIGRRLVFWLKESSLLLVLRGAWTAAQERLEPSRKSVLERRILTGEPDPRVEAAWRQVERSLGRMAERCRAAGIPLWVAVLPRRDQVRGEDPPTAYNERVARIARAHSLPVVDVLAALREAHGEGVRIGIPWDGHHTAAANAVIAEQLVPRVLERCRGDRCRPVRSSEGAAGPTHGLAEAPRAPERPSGSGDSPERGRP